MREFFRSIAFRVFAPIALLTAGVLLLHLYYVHLQEKQTYRALLENCAERGASLIVQSMRHAMLLNRREDIQKMTMDVAKSRDVHGVRIFNKDGVVVYSSNPEEVGHRVDMKAEACVGCHSGTGPALVRPQSPAVRAFETSDGRHVMALTVGIANEPACYNAPCHAHPPNQRILGILDIRLDRTDLDHLLSRHTRQAAITGLLVALLAAVLAGLIVRLSVHIPVRRLIRGTQEIAAGNLGYTIPASGSHEITVLAESFNRMSQDLKKARDALEEWSRTLEQRVKEKTEELERAQQQMVQAERMASLGKMAASVAHELNNPMSGILGLAKYVRRRLGKLDLDPQEREALSKDLEVIESEARRCGNIVKNLLLFAREGTEGFEKVDLNDVLNKAFVLISHHLELSGVKLETELCPNECVVIGNADELKQAFLAMLINAVEAMPEGGVLTVRTVALPDEDKVRVEISDTGVGIPEDVLPHIFEPFFTTKTGGEGLGLGLAVVYGIVQKHGGRIMVDSKVGQGTTFSIELPMGKGDQSA